MNVCKTCKRSDVKRINKLLAQGLSLRNIVSQFDGLNTGGLKRHKDNCIPQLVSKVIQSVREGLLADIDEVKAEIEQVKTDFVDNGQVRVQLIARRLDAIEKEAKLTGAYTKEQDNPKDIANIAKEVTRRLVENGWTPEKADRYVQQIYPQVSDAIN